MRITTALELVEHVRGMGAAATRVSLADPARGPAMFR